MLHGLYLLWRFHGFSIFYFIETFGNPYKEIIHGFLQKFFQGFLRKKRSEFLQKFAYGFLKKNPQTPPEIFPKFPASKRFPKKFPWCLHKEFFMTFLHKFFKWPFWAIPHRFHHNFRSLNLPKFFSRTPLQKFFQEFVRKFLKGFLQIFPQEFLQKFFQNFSSRIVRNFTRDHFKNWKKKFWKSFGNFIWDFFSQIFDRLSFKYSFSNSASDFPCKSSGDSFRNS